MLNLRQELLLETKDSEGWCLQNYTRGVNFWRQGAVWTADGWGAL